MWQRIGTCNLETLSTCTEKCYYQFWRISFCSSPANIIDAVFRRHPGRPILKVHNNDPAIWQQPPPNTAPGFCPAPHADTYYFTAQHIKTAIAHLVSNTNFTFGSNIYRQISGLPMGTNCAGFLANAYLYSYELDFITHARRGRQQATQTPEPSCHISPTPADT